MGSDREFDDELEAVGEGEIAVDFIKAGDFRVIWAEGVVGNVSRGGRVHAVFFSERRAIPRRCVFEDDGNGGLGKELTTKRKSRNSMVREVGCDVMMSAETAEKVGLWLLEQAKLARKRRS